MPNTIELSDRSEFKERIKQYLNIDPKKTVVLTVDMQRQYLDMEVGGQPVAPQEAARVLSNSRELLAFAREQGIPVIHVYVCHRQMEIKDGFSRSPFRKAIRDMRLREIADMPEKDVPDRLEGTLQCQVPAELVAESDLHITSKKVMDSYLGTELEPLLQHILKPETVVLTGVNTDTCVYSTTFSTANRGYKTVVISECTASMRGKDNYEMALELMSSSFAWVLTVKEFKEKVMAHSETQGLPGDEAK